MRLRGFYQVVDNKHDNGRGRWLVQFVDAAHGTERKVIAHCTCPHNAALVVSALNFTDKIGEQVTEMDAIYAYSNNDHRL